ncbi:MAG: hypothetical protein WDN08_06240 [Rhizomicrobium sp.]
MAQPAITPAPFEFTGAPLDAFGSDALSGAHASDGGPANRALNELSLALSADAGGEAKWSAGKSLRFLVVSCGLFWLAIGAAYFTLH